MIILSGIFTVLHLFFAVFILFLTLAFVTGAPFVRSNKKAVDAMMRLAKIKKGAKVYDLGSGDGTLLFRAAALGAKAVGLEINPFLVVWSQFRILFSHQQSHVRVKWQNFWQAELHDADVVFVYLLPWRMDRLETLLKTQCKHGALIISNSFIFPKLRKIAADETAHVYAFQI